MLTPDRTELEIIRVVGYRAEIGEQWSRFPVDADTPMPCMAEQFGQA